MAAADENLTDLPMSNLVEQVLPMQLLLGGSSASSSTAFPSPALDDVTSTTSCGACSKVASS